MLNKSIFRDILLVPTKNLVKNTGNESIDTYNRSEFNNSIKELKLAYTGLEDASQVLEEMKKVIIQHEANVQAEKAEEGQEGVGETGDGKLVADTSPESDTDTPSEGEGDTPAEGTDDFNFDNEGEGNASEENNTDNEGENNEGTEGEEDKANDENNEGSTEVTDEEVEQASDEKDSTEENIKDMNMAGEMFSGKLFGVRYRDLKSLIGIKSIGLNNIATSPLYVQQESLDNLKEVKDNVSMYFKEKVKEFTAKTKESLEQGKEELQDITNKATALLKSVEVKEVSEGNFNTEIELKPYYKILLQDGISKENIKSYIERTKLILNAFSLDNSRLDRVFQLANNLSSSKTSNELREKLFWEFVRPIQEALSNVTLDPISQFTTSKPEGGQSELIHVSNQDMASNGLSLVITPVKYDEKKGTYNSLTDYSVFGRSTQVYPDLDLGNNITLSKVKELTIDICTAIQETKDSINEVLETTLNSIKALEEFDSSKYQMVNDHLEDILSGLSVIVYDQAVLALAMLSKARKSLDAAAVFTSNLN